MLIYKNERLLFWESFLLIKFVTKATYILVAINCIYCSVLQRQHNELKKIFCERHFFLLFLYYGLLIVLHNGRIL